MVDTEKILKRMDRFSISTNKLAMMIERDPSSLKNRIYNFTPFKVQEMFKIADILHLRDYELREYFYTEGVKENE